MKTQKRKKENNLGYSWDTKFLIFLYREFKFMERGARKFSPTYKEALKENLQLVKDKFISYSLDIVSEKNSPYKDNGSNENGEWASLFRRLEKEDLIAEATAEIAYIRLFHKEPTEEEIEKYAAHLRYYFHHSEIHHEYKLTKRNYVKDIFEEIKPTYDKLMSILQRKGNVKEIEKEEIEELYKFLKEEDNDFAIRSVILEDFFKSEEGFKLSEEAKIEIALKLGALDKSCLNYYGEDGNLVKCQMQSPKQNLK